MGIIIKQSIKGTFFSYTGVLLGFVTVGLLWPKFLSSNEIGLINFVIASATILAHLASLGMNSVTIRMFPYFRSSEKKHHGFLSFIVLISFIGFVIAFLAFMLYKPALIENNIENSTLIVKYSWYIIPFTLSLLYYNIFDNYVKVLYDAVSGTFAKELVFRFFNLILITGIIFHIFSFQVFFNFYLLIFSLPALYLLVVIIKRKEFSFNIDFGFIRKQNISQTIFSVASFGLIGGFGTLAVANIDKLMINRYLDLSATGIYSISLLFATLVTIPARTLGKISGTLIADAWKSGDLKQIDLIYKKSCINQLIIGTYILLMIIVNLDTLYAFLPEEYKNGRYVIYFIGLASLFDMATGTNGIIISTSRYYKYQSVFVFLLLLFVIGTNIIFIPRYGITGAAVASAISTFIYNLIRYLFLLFKYKFQPFEWKQLLIPVFGILMAYLSIELIDISNIYIDFLVVSLSFSLFYAGFIYLLDFSEDINSIIHGFLGRGR